MTRATADPLRSLDRQPAPWLTACWSPAAMTISRGMTGNVTFRTGRKSLASVPNPGKTVTKASRLRGSRGVIVGS
jgi:hypothetical protein